MPLNEIGLLVIAIVIQFMAASEHSNPFLGKTNFKQLSNEYGIGQRNFLR